MEENYENSEGFMIPQKFLSQLTEYSTGYILLVCNEKGELYAHEAYDSPIIKLGLVNFADMHVAAIQKHLHNNALKEEERLESEDDSED